MEVRLIKIGNSKGIRIPAPLLEQCGFEQSADLSIVDGRIVIQPARKARQGWGESIQKNKPKTPDAPMLPEAMPNRFDDEEWTW